MIASTDAPISSTPYFCQRAVLAERDRQVERGLAADRRQQRVGALALDDRLEHLRRERLDVGAVGELRVGHDRRRVAVDQHDFEAFGAQRLARLRAGVVELARLADDDRAGADDEHAFDVGTLRHLTARLFHLVEELPEQVVRVVRARRRLGVILHAEHRLGLVAQPLDGAVVEVDVGDLHVRRQRRRIDGEAVVLRGDLDLAGLELLDRVVGAAVAELQLVGLAAHRQRQDLVAEADAEHRHVGLDQLARVVDGVVEHRRIARAVAQEHAVRARRQQVRRRRGRPGTRGRRSRTP